MDLRRLEPGVGRWCDGSGNGGVWSVLEAGIDWREVGGADVEVGVGMGQLEAGVGGGGEGSGCGGVGAWERGGGGEVVWWTWG